MHLLALGATLTVCLLPRVSPSAPCRRARMAPGAALETAVSVTDIFASSTCLFQPRFTGKRPADSTRRPNSSFVRCCLYLVELSLFRLRRTGNPTPISALRANKEKLDSYGDDFKKRIRFQRHAVETKSHVSTRLRLEEFPVETWRISLHLCPEGDNVRRHSELAPTKIR